MLIGTHEIVCISSEVVGSHFRDKNGQKIYITVFKNIVMDNIYESLFMRTVAVAGFYIDPGNK
jgi:hypothetical protein